jgi:peptidoglycan-associated lipoprotein
MKLKQLAQVTLIACGVLALSACAARHPASTGGYNEAGLADANGAQAAGMGEGENFGGSNDGAGSKQGINKKTYYFDYDSNVVHDEDKAAIAANANYLVAHTNTKVIVEGHTDPRGSREYNVALGERRANAVADLLRSKGVNAGQIRVVSYGAERLAVPGHNEQDYQLDRRAIIVYQR